MDWLIPGALALDLILGDPRLLPHPVVYIGRLIGALEETVEELVPSRRMAGVLLTILVLAITGAVAAGLLRLAAEIAPRLGLLVALWMAYTTLALRSLHRESREVIRWLERGDIHQARSALSLIVGRDTAELDEDGILRACIETVAENTSDGVVAPLFYLFLGGPIAGILYKAASTLDSMVGYRNDRYRELGWASARLDDLLNLIPARLTAALMILSAVPLRLDPWSSLKIVLRDARRVSSPNAGFPEAAVAGATGVRLGGPAVYLGERVDKPTLGDNDRPPSVAAYRQTIRLMYLTSFLALGLGLVLTNLFV